MRLPLIALSLIAAAGGCANPISAPSSAPDVVLDVAGAGSAATLRVGQRLAVRLAGNPTTGYAWTCADPAGGVVTLSGEPSYVADTAPAGTVGSGGKFVFNFTAVAAGSRDLRFSCARAWEKGVPPAQSAVVSVRVE